MQPNTEQHGAMVFHIIEKDVHKPLVEGKANRANIEEQITIGLYSKEIPPCDQEDVDWICELVDVMMHSDWSKNLKNKL